MSTYKIDGATLTAIADAIREKSESTETYNPSEMPQSILDIPTGGGSELPDWFEYLGTVGFQKVTFPTGTDVVVDLSSWNGFIISFQQAYGMRSVKIKTPITTSAYSVAVMFQGAINNENDFLETIDLTETSTMFSSMQGFVSNRRKLVSIIGKINTSSCTNFNSAFLNCEALENIEFVEGSINYGVSFANSPNLSANSRQSITDGLAYLTDGTTQTLDIHANVADSLTDTQLNTIYSKNWLLE